MQVEFSNGGGAVAWVFSAAGPVLAWGRLSAPDSQKHWLRAQGRTLGF